MKLMAAQVCIIMLCMGVAETVEEAFFLARWIQAFNQVQWAGLRVTLQHMVMLQLLPAF